MPSYALLVDALLYTTPHDATTPLPRPRRARADIARHHGSACRAIDAALRPAHSGDPRLYQAHLDGPHALDPRSAPRRARSEDAPRRGRAVAALHRSRRGPRRDRAAARGRADARRSRPAGRQDAARPLAADRRTG